MSDLEIRPISSREDDIAFAACMGTAFGARLPQELFDREIEAIGRERTLAAFEDGQLVGTTAWFPLELTLPGGGATDGAGVTSVTTLPSHRRRGVLTGLMKRQLNEFVEAGLSCSLLTASEGGIYRRFGYGVATHKCRYTLDKRLALLRREADVPGDPAGRIRLVTPDEAAKIFPQVWDAARRVRPGEVSFPAAFWETMFGPQPPWRDVDQNKRFLAVYEVAGEAVGCVDYQVADRADGRVVDLDLLFSTNLPAYVALWKFLIGIDLTPSIHTRQRPVEEPLRQMLTDPRCLEMSGYQDSLWVRPLDVVRLLEARRYAPCAAGELTMFVRDPLLPQVEGVYGMEVDGAGAASARRIGDGGQAADLELEVSELGAVLLGGVSVATLRQAGLVRENTVDAGWRADALFSSDVPPFLTIGF